MSVCSTGVDYPILGTSRLEPLIADCLNNADVEPAAFDAAVTDWARGWGFERP